MGLRAAPLHVPAPVALVSRSAVPEESQCWSEHMSMQKVTLPSARLLKWSFFLLTIGFHLTLLLTNAGNYFHGGYCTKSCESSKVSFQLSTHARLYFESSAVRIHIVKSSSESKAGKAYCILIKKNIHKNSEEETLNLQFFFVLFGLVLDVL